MKQQMMVAGVASTTKRKCLSSIAVEQNKERLLLLPPEILLDILSRLPAVSVLRCKCVCKTLHSLIFRNISNHQFAKAHLHHQQQPLDASDTYNFISMYNYDKEYIEKAPMFQFLQYVENDEDDDDEYISYKVRKFDFPMMNWNPFRCHYYKAIASCNGLVYLVQPKSDPFMIWNPVTRECFYLPRDTNVDKEESSNYIISAFGYHPGTDKYKVVRISWPPTHGPGQVQVYTIGNGKDGGRWRNKGQFDRMLNKEAVLFDGILYWENGFVIVSFDLAEEKFDIVPGPPDVSSCFIYQLCVMRGCMFLILLAKDNKLHVWVMKKDKKTWIYQDESMLWNQSISLLACPVTTNGKVLFWSRDAPQNWLTDSMLLAAYDPKTMKVKLPTPGEHLVAGPCFIVVPHIESLISLKALGEENAKIISD